MPWNNERMLTDADGNFIPQVWDPSQNKFVPYEAKVQLSGTIVVETVGDLPSTGYMAQVALVSEGRRVFIHDGNEWGEW